MVTEIIKAHMVAKAVEKAAPWACAAVGVVTLAVLTYAVTKEV